MRYTTKQNVTLGQEREWLTEADPEMAQMLKNAQSLSLQNINLPHSSIFSIWDFIYVRLLDILDSRSSENPKQSKGKEST